MQETINLLETPNSFLSALRKLSENSSCLLPTGQHMLKSLRTSLKELVSWYSLPKRLMDSLIFQIRMAQADTIQKMLRLKMLKKLR